VEDLDMEVTIVVENGMVVDVFGTSKDVFVNVIDLDGAYEFEELEQLRDEVEELRKTQFILG
jgi:hypothetical protein